MKLQRISSTNAILQNTSNSQVPEIGFIESHSGANFSEQHQKITESVWQKEDLGASKKGDDDLSKPNDTSNFGLNEQTPPFVGVDESEFSLEEKGITLLREYVNTERKYEASELVNRALSSAKIRGSSDDYHNWAVDLARLNLYDDVCKILERGLSNYPSSVDLLANYLYYGCESECSKIQNKAWEFFETLQSIPEKDWTWRAYSFSIEYLLIQRERKTQSEASKTEDEIQRILAAYYKNFPKEERPYLVEARIYSKTDKEKVAEILKSAHQNLNSCPLSSLRYADILFNNASSIDDYEEAHRYIEMSLKQTSDFEIDHGYAYFLKGLCLVRFLQERKDYSNSNGEINEIYSCFRIASENIMDLLPRNLRIMRKEIRILEILSNIKYD